MRKLAKAFGQVIRERRIELKLTQQVLAERLKIARPLISRMEAGKHLLSVSSLWNYARCLGLSPHEVVRRAEERVHEKDDHREVYDET